MDSDFHQIIYLTRIHKNFECDAFFPRVDSEKYSLSEAKDVPQGVQEENGIKYVHEVYIKNQKETAASDASPEELPTAYGKGSVVRDIGLPCTKRKTSSYIYFVDP
ncbi:dihydrofolate reductase [Nephila pilipes]|uniref:dihydrofolate reductase n=1 Tax=Nephila pilipes TaxID=299642 RepID=A0A8X6NZP5_NEPPI|nr:dihydrofolate reductase [Nephila pilipes]